MAVVSGGSKRPSTLPWTVLGILALIFCWEIAARMVAADILLPGPVPTLLRLGTLLTNERFLAALGFSLVRVLWGLVLSVPPALAVGIAAGLDRRIFAFLRPLFALVSATPVLSVILIAFLWFGQERTPIFASFLIIFPVMSATTIAGVGAVDSRLREALRIYGFSPCQMLRHFYLPSLMPFILGGLRSSLALSWKVVVAAEVIVQPLYGLGTGMQNAKAQLETTELFAWTAATVIIAAGTELLLLRRRRNSPSTGDAS